MLITFESEAIDHLWRTIPTRALRNKAIKKAKEITINSIDKEIQKNRELLRALRSESESVKRGVYAEISKLERIKLELMEGEYGI